MSRLKQLKKIKEEKGFKAAILDGAAFLISVAFSPYLVSVLFILIISFIYADSLREFLPWILINLFFIAIIPASYIFWLVEEKKVSDIHLSNHKDRKIPFLISAVSALVGVVVLYYYGVATPILAVTLAYALNATILFVITLFWKISIHSALFANLIFICIVLFGDKYWPLFFLWVPLAWARVHRKKHTPEQVLFGALIAICVTAIVLYGFGYKIGG